MVHQFAGQAAEEEDVEFKVYREDVVRRGVEGDLRTSLVRPTYSCMAAKNLTYFALVLGS